MGVPELAARLRVPQDRFGLLGRVNATFRTLLTGALTVGAGLAGVTGEILSAQPTLWLGAAGIALVWVPIFCSGIRTLRELPPSAATANSS